MIHLAKKEESRSSSLISGRIKGTREALYWVETEYGIRPARRASSCLMEPRISDLVLLFDVDGEAFILAVLAREEGSPASLLIEDGLSIKVQNGNFSVAAQGVHLSGEKIALSSVSLQVDSLNGKVRVMDLSFLGKTLNSQIERIKWAAQYCDSVVDRLTQRVKRSYRWIEDFEQTRAGRVLCFVKDTLFLKGKQSFFMAEKKIKMDAEKIHLG